MKGYVRARILLNGRGELFSGKTVTVNKKEMDVVSGLGVEEILIPCIFPPKKKKKPRKKKNSAPKKL